MCLAIPMRLMERSEIEGVVELDGVRRTVSLILLPDAEVGQHLLIHAGYAIGSVDEAEAQITLALLREYADAMVDL
jgi:hydrogenase expression/formation protein HypC